MPRAWRGGATLIRWSSNPKLGHMHLHPTPADHQDLLEHHLDHRKPECLAGLVHCCTRMSWDLVQGGDPLHAAVLSLSYLANFGQFFRLQKVHATCIAEVDEKNWGPELILTPSKRVFFKGGDTFPELSSPTHQLGLKPPYDKRGFSKIEGSPSILKKTSWQKKVHQTRKR